MTGSEDALLVQSTLLAMRVVQFARIKHAHFSCIVQVKKNNKQTEVFVAPVKFRPILSTGIVYPRNHLS